jgi:hypothetical protein
MLPSIDFRELSDDEWRRFRRDLSKLEFKECCAREVIVLDPGGGPAVVALRLAAVRRSGRERLYDDSSSRS